MGLTSPFKLQLAVAGAAVIAFLLVRNNLKEVAASTVKAGIGAMGEVGTGVIVGIGDVIGVPRTSETECERAMREGSAWEASKYCDGITYFKYIWNR